jgi:hypothetical protein
LNATKNSTSHLGLFSFFGCDGQLRLVGIGLIRLEQLSITTGKEEREKSGNGELTHGTPPYQHRVLENQQL